MRKNLIKHKALGMRKVYYARKRLHRKNFSPRVSLFLGIRYEMMERCHDYAFMKKRKSPPSRHMDKVVFDVRVEHWLRKMSEKVF